MTGAAGPRSELTLEDIASNEGALGENSGECHKVNARNSILPALLAAIALTLTTFSTAVYMAAAKEVSELRTEYTEKRADYEKLARDLSDVRDESAVVLMNCTSSVDDPGLCTALDDKFTEAELVDIVDPGEIDPYEANRVELKAAISKLASILEEADPAYRTLTAAIKPIRSNTADKTRDDFDKALSDGAALVTKGREFVASTDGKVEDDALRTKVTESADAVDAKLAEARDADDGSIRDYTGVTIGINAAILELRRAIEALEDGNKAWIQEEKIREAEALASAATSERDKAELEKAEAQRAAREAEQARQQAVAEAEQARQQAVAEAEQARQQAVAEAENDEESEQDVSEEASPE